MREMQSSKSPFRASFITMSSPDAAWSIELLMGVNGRLAQSWPTHSPPAPAWSLPGPHQATCWKGNQVRKGSWLSEGEGRRPVWTNRGVFTDVGEGQALCPGSVSAHSETRLPKLRQVYLRVHWPCWERSWGWIKPMTKRPIVRRGTSQSAGWGEQPGRCCVWALSHYRVCAMTHIPPHVREHQRFLTCS